MKTTTAISCQHRLQELGDIPPSSEAPLLTLTSQDKPLDMESLENIT